MKYVETPPKELEGDLKGWINWSNKKAEEVLEEIVKLGRLQVITDKDVFRIMFGCLKNFREQVPFELSVTDYTYIDILLRKLEEEVKGIHFQPRIFWYGRFGKFDQLGVDTCLSIHILTDYIPEEAEEKLWWMFDDDKVADEPIVVK